MRAASRARPGVQHDHLQTKHRQAGPNGKPWDSPTKIPQGVFKCTDQSKGDLPKNDMQRYCGKRLCCHLVCITVTLSNVFYPCFRSLRRRHRIAGKTSSLSPSGNVVMLTGEKRDLPDVVLAKLSPEVLTFMHFSCRNGRCKKVEEGQECLMGTRLRQYHMLCGALLRVWKHVSDVVADITSSSILQIVRLKAKDSSKQVGESTW